MKEAQLTAAGIVIDVIEGNNLNKDDVQLIRDQYPMLSEDEFDDIGDIEEVIVDASAAKGQSQPILVHTKGDNKSKSNKTTAA